MNRQEVEESLVKYKDYLEANGVRFPSIAMYGSLGGVEFGAMLGGKEDIIVALLSLVADQQGYTLTRKAGL